MDFVLSLKTPVSRMASVPGSDVYLDCSTGAMNAHIQLLGVIPRPAKVRIEAGLGPLKTSFPVRDPGQIVHMSVTNYKGEQNSVAVVGDGQQADHGPEIRQSHRDLSARF